MRAALVALMLMGTSCAAQAQANGPIPPLRGTVLTGEKVELPAGLKGKVGVLVVGFSQASRDEATAWGRRLAADYRDSNAVVYYEMPVLESVPKLLRGWVLKKIGDSVPDRAKPRFLPVVDHEKEWKTAAGYKSADDAYVLVVDGSGIVRETFAGAASDDKYAQVKRQVELMQAIALK